MAKAKSKSVSDDIAEQLDGARDRIRELESRIEDLEGELEGAIDEEPSSFALDQLESLAIDVDSSSAPQTYDQWRRCLNGIRRGEDWRHGTWK